MAANHCEAGCVGVLIFEYFKEYKNIDGSQALSSFAALSQETRLRVLRHLVQVGPDGRAAGAIADAMDVSPSNLSFHLKELERAGLIAQRRAARSIIYAVNFEAHGALIRFLMDDCCDGRPEICGPAIASVTSCDAVSSKEKADA